MINKEKIPDRDVVLTSRIRLARNFDDLPFSTEQSENIAAVCIERICGSLNELEEESPYVFFAMEDLSPWERTSLVEDHLISVDLTKKTAGALFLKKDRHISLMINEEDHIRLQAIEPGTQLLKAAEKAFEVEDQLQKNLHFAYDHHLGYLTACPTNTGTGMRASYMLHLPMLSLFNQMGTVNQSVAKIGLTIRGMYGEGSETLGNIYQVSNQITLGKTEEEIIASVMAVGKQIIQMERELRERAYKNNKVFVEDQIFRSLGLLKYAKQMRNREFMKHWSNIRVGASLKLIDIPLEIIDQLLNMAQDGHVKNQKEEETNIDVERAKQIQRFLKENVAV